MKREKRLIYLIIYYLIYYGIVDQFVWKDNHVLSFIPDILIFYLTYYTLPKESDVHYRKIISTSALYVYCVFLAVGTISWFFEHSSFVSLLWGFRIYVRYAFLFFSMYNCLNYKDVIRIKNIFIKAFKINLIFIPVEYYFFGQYSDWIGGTFSGGNSAFVFFSAHALYLFLSDYFTTHKKIDWSYLSLYFVALLFVAIVGEIRMMYYFIPLLVYSVYTITRKINLSNLFVLIFLVFALVPIYKYAMSFDYGDEYIENTFDANKIQDYTTMEGGFGTKFNRGSVWELSMKYLTDSSSSFYVGHGFGVASISDVIKSDFAQKHKDIGYQFFTVSYVIAETGVIGFVLVVSFHLILLFRFYRYYMRYRKDLVISYWAGIGVVSIVLQFFLAWYNSIPVARGYFSVILWAMVTIAIKERLKELNRIR